MRKLSFLLLFMMLLLQNVITSYADSNRNSLAVTHQKIMTFNSTGSHRPIQQVTSLVFSKDGNLIVSGQWNGEIKIWDVKNAKVLRRLIGHTDPVNVLVFSPDGKRIISASGGALDYTLREWELITGKLLKTIQLGGIPDSIIFSHDGKKIAFNGWDVLYIYEYDGGIRSEILKYSFDSMHTPIKPVAFDPAGEIVFMDNGQALDIRSKSFSRKFQLNDASLKDFLLMNYGSEVLFYLLRDRNNSEINDYAPVSFIRGKKRMVLMRGYNSLSFLDPATENRLGTFELPMKERELISSAAYDPVNHNCVFGTSTGRIDVIYGLRINGDSDS